METVLFGYLFFRAPAPATAKTKEDRKKERFGAGTKPINEVNTSV